jgi:hypothetical protein
VSFDPRVSIGALGFLAPRGDAAKELVALLERRESLVAKLDDLDRQQRAATAAASEASSALAQLEPRALGGEKIAAAERRRLEDALAAARATAAEPWAERRAGAREAVGDCQRQVQAHVGEHLGELLDELGEDGERAARAVDAGAAAILDAYAERARVEQAITTLAAMVRPPRVGDISRTRAEKLHAAASELLAVVVKMPRACSSIRGRPGTGASSSRRRYRHECSAGCGA